MNISQFDFTVDQLKCRGIQSCQEWKRGLERVMPTKATESISVKVFSTSMEDAEEMVDLHL
jgi:hypothetical protein